MPYELLDVRPMTKRIGAEIFGIDLNRPLGNHEVSELHDALMQHQVIFFRDQPLTHESHKCLGRAFGELAIHSGVAGLPDHPEIVAIHADENSKFVAGENWHSDLSCNAEPPMGSILYMHTLPDHGGDTLFSSMYAAYNALSPAMKAFLDPLTAIHDGEHVYRPIVNDPTKTYPCNTHPVVRTHPVTGRKCLFVNASYTIRIPELSKEESDAVLAFLFEHVKNPNFQVRFRWQKHSVAFWDNRCTQHFAVWDYFPEVRSGFRVTVAGDKPF
ncbi:taurine dioxygenase [Sphingomonas oleivorans]|uniref:Taurine dioxygenase n=1 Tax=Sphingomonas oleivorans TaxID=1735121 RepID=A0A2T5FZ43_9SPHN|nr:TauD/TfdA family dioxygenase [Sphingomonas oleivorans]PTQ11841.1 taurine dioxygenase [Sphingomonas oleivorans]